jgi:HEAT repeat protein
MRFALAGVLTLGIVAVAAVEGAEVRDLIAKLGNKDAEVRRAAAKEIGELGADGKAAVPALRKSLRDSDLFVRRFSAEALGQIGVEAKAAIPELALAMNDEKKEVALAAVEALGKMGASSIQALTSAIKDTNKDPAIRKQAALGLGKIGLPARSAVPALTDVLTGKIGNGGSKGKNKDKDGNDIRLEVATALGSVAKPDDKDAIEALKALSEGKQRNKALKKAAGDSLKKINNR